MIIRPQYSSRCNTTYVASVHTCPNRGVPPLPITLTLPISSAEMYIQTLSHISPSRIHAPKVAILNFEDVARLAPSPGMVLLTLNAASASISRAHTRFSRGGAPKCHACSNDCRC